MLLTILVFFITIVVLVLVHELGHFLVAKKFNVKVLEFGFGLPPRIWGKRKGETIYSINWLPFGGFVKLFGEDETNKEALGNQRSFAYQTPGKKIAIVVAGVTMNMVLAWILFWVVLSSQNYKTQIPLLAEYKFFGASQTDERLVLVGSVAEGSPAGLAGIVPNDRILAINDEFVGSVDELVDKIKANAGKNVKLTLSDVQKTEFKTVDVTPRQNPPPGQGALGVSLGSIKVADVEYAKWWQKLLSGPLHGYNLTVYSMKVLGGTLASSFATKNLAPVTHSVSGPVGITAIVGDILSIKDPLIPYLSFMAILSLNLAVINILPFPALDGGRLVFLLFEAVTRRKAHPALEKYVHTAGMVILLALIMAITLSDIKKLVF